MSSKTLPRIRMCVLTEDSKRMKRQTKTTNTMTRVKYEVFVKIPAFETQGLGIYESNGLLIFDWGTKRCTSIGGGGPFLIDLCETKSDAKQTINRFKSSFYNLLGNSSFKISSRTFNTF